MARTIVRGGTVVTLNQNGDIFERGTVAFSERRIRYVGRDEGCTVDDEDTVVEAAGRIVMPGLVNAHSHSAMTYLRGLAEDVRSPTWFRETGLLEADMSEEDLYWSAVLGCYEMLRKGITCVADRFSRMDIVGEAVRTVGLRAILGPSLYDVGRGRVSLLAEAVRLVKHYGVSAEQRVSCGLAPVGPDTASTELLRSVREAATDLGARIFIHVAQARHELEAVRERGWNGSVRYLSDLNMLGPDVVAAHCMFVEPEEIRILADTGTKVAHCPVSNAKLEARIAPVTSMINTGVVVGLGTDCAPGNNGMDMFAEMKWAALLSKIQTSDPTLSPAEGIVRMGTSTSAEVLGLKAHIGSLEVGKAADLIVVDRSQVHLLPSHDVYTTIVYSVHGSDVVDVFVDGDQVVRHGRVLTIDENEVKSHATAWSDKRRSGLLT